MPGRAQLFFQTGADERIVCFFNNDRFSGQWACLVFEIVAWLAGPVCRVGLGRIVADVIERHALRAPVSQQASNILLCIRIVAAPPTGMIDRLLQINDQERRRMRECLHKAPGMVQHGR
jgi:hypothetical protein